MTGPELFQTEPESDPHAKYAVVAVERGLDRLGDRAADGLTYRVGDDPVEPGDRVEVPLGRGGTPTAGVVVATGDAQLLNGFDPRKVKPLSKRLGAGLPRELLELARWLSRYYVCPLGMVLASMTPAAVRKGVGKRTEVVLTPAQAPATDDLTPSAKRAWAALSTLSPTPYPATARRLADLIGDKTIGAINRLKRAGLLEEQEREVVRVSTPLVRAETEHSDRPTPTPAQREIIEGIAGSLGSFGVELLRGVTGSGKTEVYLRLIERVLESGGSALVLVPEISLTPQTAGRFEARFGTNRVAVMHSGLTASQRHAEWERARTGAARLVVGARSAVFAPLSELGLIVVDEEHDTSYKQDQLPRYHARDVAIKRAQLCGARVVLGSATPSLESWHNAVMHRFRLSELTERVGGGSLPPVELIDLAQERKRGMSREASIGPTLTNALMHTLSGNGQALLLLNRRGFASHLCCPDRTCGWTLRCDHCEAAMVLHKRHGRAKLLRCHHCTAEQRRPDRCPRCGKTPIPLGTGTQRAEEQLAPIVDASGLDPESAMIRVDADTMQRAADYFDALGRFASGEARVLLGTQMIAKGLDFPGVELVGVLSGDTALAVPDFRAEERTFQLISQVAGRAGRAGRPARVLVQTAEPSAPVLQAASRHDYLTFASRELATRKAAHLPPEMRMVRIVCRHHDRERAERTAKDTAAALRDAASPEIRVDGPFACPIERIADKWRFAVDLTAHSAAQAQGPLRALRASGLLKSDANTAVDVDPVALL
ncbi:MAG: primosomal protein N' [Planctomycetota bacterium]